MIVNLLKAPKAGMQPNPVVTRSGYAPVGTYLMMLCSSCWDGVLDVTRELAFWSRLRMSWASTMVWQEGTEYNLS